MLITNSKLNFLCFHEKCMIHPYITVYTIQSVCHVHAPVLFTDLRLPVSFSNLSSKPISWRCSGVDTERAMTSPTASWNPVSQRKSHLQCTIITITQSIYVVNCRTHSESKTILKYM